MKAILVIDMPSSCIECRYSMLEGNICLLNKDVIYIKDGDKGKSKNCLLRPVPDAQEYLYYPINENIQAFNEGYNKCREDLLGDRK